MPEERDGGTDRPKHWGKGKQSNAEKKGPRNDPPPGRTTNAQAEQKRKK